MSWTALPGVEAALARELATSMGKDCGGTEKDEPTEEQPEGKVWIGRSRLDDGRIDSTSDYDTVNTSTARIPSRRLSRLDLALSRKARYKSSLGVMTKALTDSILWNGDQTYGKDLVRPHFSLNPTLVPHQLNLWKDSSTWSTVSALQQVE